ncbi:MAG: hypothetical protein B5M48_02695 [Candidatus Omnitrophica bacterium 4484_213]|nr:MAG: hypothetical protein B5M48_02695 [Candidatus Omnitrophica bacterium 4484_213]
MLSQEINNLPKAPGVYFFCAKNDKILYIGSSGSIRTRIASHLQSRDSKIRRMLEEAVRIRYRKTNSVLEAVILEAKLIKAHQPKYNVKLKDDKSFVVIVISKDEFPRVWVTRLSKVSAPGEFFGPYTNAKLARRALEILRKIFPCRVCKNIPQKACLEYHLGRCPAPCLGKISPRDYKRNINHLKLILKGKAKTLIAKLKKEMKEAADKENFEKASQIRNKIFAFSHLRDIGLLTRESPSILQGRIEAYDISNIKEKLATGSMTVFEDGELARSQYRKFRIEKLRGGDVGMMKEVLERRFAHREWPYPCLILVDGGRAQLNAAKKVLESRDLKIPLVAIAKPQKRQRRMPDRFYTDLALSPQEKKSLFRLRDEAHRFAITYHRLLRKKSIIPNKNSE